MHELQYIKLLEYELGPYPENRDVYLNSSAILDFFEEFLVTEIEGL